MAYDEALAQRIRKVLAGKPGITEKKMFGGLCFLLHGNMVGGVAADDLMVRVGPHAYEEAVTQAHARAMNFTGRPLKGLVFVAPPGCASAAALSKWLARGLAFAQSSRLPKPSARSLGKTVDDYETALTGWQQRVFASVRRLIREAAPKANETIKWGQPVYEENGPFCYLRAFPKAVNFGFWRGAELRDDDGLIHCSGKQMGHIKLASADDIRPELFRRLVRQALSLNLSKGDPTRSR